MKYVSLALAVMLCSFLSACSSGAAGNSGTLSPSAPAAATVPAVAAGSKVLKISPEDAKKLLDENKGVVLLDVRTAEEYAAGHIAGSVLLPLDELEAKAAETLNDKDTTILVYCRTGVRSAKAADLLAQMGYTHIYDMAGGITAWPYGVVK